MKTFFGFMFSEQCMIPLYYYRGLAIITDAAGGGGQCHVDVTYRDDFISKGESQTRNCCPSETRPMLGGKHPGECRCVCNGC